MPVIRSFSTKQWPDTAARAAGLFGLWLILTGANPADLAAGVVAAAAATWVSLRLLPPVPLHLRPLALAAFLLHLAREAIRAGFDVAWRALDPRLPLKPGFVSHRLSLPAGSSRDIFGILASLMPGTVAAGREGRDGLIVHCLDIRQPVADQLAADEARLAELLGVRDDA
jgi:multicomponent Na+:H+ antiporter subunit E